MQLPNVQFPPASWPGGRYSFLLCSLLLLFATSPLLPDSWVASVVIDGIIALMFLCGILSLGNRQFAWVVVVLILVPELIGIGLGWVTESGGSLGGGIGGSIRSVAMILFCAYMAFHIMCDVMRSRHITGDTICGALCVYLLLGLLWAFGYLLIAHYVPNSFNASDEIVAIASVSDSREVFSMLVYFSFVTLTTLGYGDISPVSPIAQTACWLEAVIGQLFLATFVAGLVGMHIADRIEEHRK